MFSLWQSLKQAFEMLVRFDPELWAIVLMSLRVSGISAVLTVLAAVPIAYAITQRKFPGKRLLIGTINSFMAVPAVVIGLICYLLLSRSGPLGIWRLLYSPGAMVAAQGLLALPLMTGLAIAALQNVNRLARETMVTLGAGRWQIAWGILREARFAITAAFITGLARLLGETGMTMMVGGNIRGQTRVMTTAIALETMKGNFELGIALGMILLIVAIGINAVLQVVQGRAGR